MNRLVDDMLTLAGAETGSSCDRAPVELDDFLADLRARPAAARASATTRSTGDRRRPRGRSATASRRCSATWSATPSRHTEPGERITSARGARTTARIEFSVSDTGPGIPPEQLDRSLRPLLPHRRRRGRATRAAAASAWRSRARSSRPTAGGSGPSRARARAPRSGSSFPATDPSPGLQPWAAIGSRRLGGEAARRGRCSFRRAGSRPSCSCSCSASSFSACSPTAPTADEPPIPQRVVDPHGRVLFTRRRRPRRPGGLPAQRADGVRLDLRPRRLPRPRLHRRLPAPVGAGRAPGLRRRRARTRAAPADASRTSRPTATTRAPSTLDLHRRPGARPSGAARALPRTSSAARPPKFGLRPEAITNPQEIRAADGVLRLDGLGGVRAPAGPRLLVHQQLAARAAGRQRADRERARVERALADRAARRHRPACSPPSAAGTSSAGTGASRRRSRFRAPGDVAPDAGAARRRPGSSS